MHFSVNVFCILDNKTSNPARAPNYFIQNHDNVFILHGSTSEAILVVPGVLRERRDSPLGNGENDSLTDNGQTSLKTSGGSRKALPCWAKINTKSVLLAQLPSRE